MIYFASYLFVGIAFLLFQNYIQHLTPNDDHNSEGVKLAITVIWPPVMFVIILSLIVAILINLKKKFF